MDGAQACYPYLAVEEFTFPQRVGGRRGFLFLKCYEALGVILSETASGADLGGSSKYSNENFED
jgi:hypothetical protein